ncbi:SLC13 family permease, partial [Mycobacterium tuberculosis]|uniref:SLC13 family permease n=1 Tax=Mycobacterium tuberculosis TaxID=1773 RepID=UPI0023517F66
LVTCGIVLLAVFTAFIAHSPLHMEPSMVALLGAGILVVASRLKPAEYLSSVEWDTLLFFAGLFIMVGALVKTGVVKQLARVAISATGGNTLAPTMVIPGPSGRLRGGGGHGPEAAAMAPGGA